MTRTRLVLPVLAVLLTVPAADASGGLFPRKSKTDAAKVKQLTDALRTDPDERKRKAAAAELRDYDPRAHAELLPALVGALQRDPSAAVRAEVADVIGQLKPVSPVAGLALEAAAGADPARPVRDAAQQALWEYHISGYRSARGADGIAGQTPEPPLARRPAPRVAHVPPEPVQPAASTNPPPVVPPSSLIPSVDPNPITSTFPVPSLAALPPPEPVAPAAEPVPSLVVLVTAAPPPQLNATAEPPLAKQLPPLPDLPLPLPTPVLGPTIEPPPAPSATPPPPVALPPLPGKQ